jgi:predicted RNase H-like HicB family nuclease
MARDAGMEDQLATIARELRLQDSLANSSPREAGKLSKADLLAAKETLEAARDSMDDWMSGYTPVREEIKHEEALRIMQNQFSSLQKVDARMRDAMSQAKTAIEAHKRSIDSLMALPAHSRKR